MHIQWEFYGLLFVIALWTLANLPLISIDAAVRLQMWLREQLRQLDRQRDTLEAERTRKKLQRAAKKEK